MNHECGDWPDEISAVPVLPPTLTPLRLADCAQPLLTDSTIMRRTASAVADDITVARVCGRVTLVVRPPAVCTRATR